MESQVQYHRNDCPTLEDIMLEIKNDDALFKEELLYIQNNVEYFDENAFPLLSAANGSTMFILYQMLKDSCSWLYQEILNYASYLVFAKLSNSNAFIQISIK